MNILQKYREVIFSYRYKSYLLPGHFSLSIYIFRSISRCFASDYIFFYFHYGVLFTCRRSSSYHTFICLHIVELKFSLSFVCEKQFRTERKRYKKRIGLILNRQLHKCELQLIQKREKQTLSAH